MPENTFHLKLSGRAEIPLPAERAVINVVVSSEGIDKAKVASEIISAAHRIETMLRELSVTAATPLARWSKTSLSTSSYVPPPKRSSEISNIAKEQPRRYRGSTTFEIRFKDFEALGSFGTKITSLEHVEVKDLEWKLTEATEAKYRSQLRKDAAKDAQTKAQDYCDVLGCVNLRATELHEIGTQHTQPFAVRHRLANSTAHPYSERVRDEGNEEFEFTPQEIRMTMDVSIKFHAESTV